jgi:hypothetical protein
MNVYLLTALMIFNARRRISYMLKIFVKGKGKDYEDYVSPDKKIWEMSIPDF